MYQRSIFWFRQDLRVYDNKWLILAVQSSKEILPLFILDTNLIDTFLWIQDKKFWFLREALENLDMEIQRVWGKWLQVLHGNPQEIIPLLVKKYQIDAVFTNTSYGRYGMHRDETLKHTLSIPFLGVHDFLLVEPEKIPQRKVFTPFYKLWQKQISSTLTQETSLESISSFSITESKSVSHYILLPKHPYFTIAFWKKRLSEYPRSDYADTRNDLDKDGTSRLSPYIRFGVFSIRQVYNRALETNNVTFLSELAWREFWHHIAYYFPESKEQEFQEKRRHIRWSYDTSLFQAWCEWKTGYPIVDAAMKQLLETNWMHGRARMIVASFLTKDLHIDWRWGEVFFKKHLLDGDENVNFWNWQWSASVWADPKPLRIFSPLLQSEKFDPEWIFIKKYLPELEGEPISFIHNPLEHRLAYTTPPIVDHRKETVIARQLYKYNI